MFLLGPRWLYHVVLLACVAVGLIGRPDSQGAPLPRLAGTRLPDQQIRVGWPSDTKDFILESSAALDKGAAWATVSGAVQVDGSGFFVVLAPGSTSRFFRLRQTQGTPLASLEETSPAQGESGVAVTRETILRFTAPLASSTTVGNERLYAEFGGRRLLSRIQLSSDRRTLTLFYLEPLPGSSRVRVTLKGDGLTDATGGGVDVDGDGLPGGVAQIDFNTVSVTAVEKTAVCGRVFASELATTRTGDSVNVPLAGVTVTVDGKEETLRAVTDDNGDFRLEPAPAGDFFVHIDGRTAVRSVQNDFPRGAYYPFVGKKWASVAGEEINIGDIFLPLIVEGSLKPVSANQETLVTFPSDVLTEHPELAGVTVTVPANALLSDAGVRGGMVGIAPVSPDRLPSPLPPGLDFPLVITVQTDGPSNFDVPVPVCFPNLPDPRTGQTKAPGAQSALWSFNHDIGDWEVVGSMTVSADGKLVCTDPGVGIRQPGWHADGPGSQATGGNTQNSQPRNPTRPRPTGNQECALNDCPCEGNCHTGREVYLQSGEEVLTATDLLIPGRAGLDFRMERTYRSRLDFNGPIGFGWNFTYNEALFFEPNGNVVRYTGRSHEATWTRQDDGTYTAPPGYFGMLARDLDGIFVLTEPDGFQRLYREDGRVICHQDRFNNRILFDYDPRGNLHRVVDVFGREIEFTFETQGDGIDRLTRVEDFLGRQIHYQYDANGDLVSVTAPAISGTSTGNDFPNGRTVRYAYSSGFSHPDLNHNLLSVTAPEEVAHGGPPRLQWTYGTSFDSPLLLDRVLTETEGGTNGSGVASGGTRRFEYSALNADAPPGQLDIPRGQARITERNGNVKEFYVNERQLHILTREFTRGRRAAEPEFYETRSYFDEDGQLIRRVFPEGNEVRYLHASNGPRRSRANVIEIRQIADPTRGGGPDLVTTFTYEPLYNQILTMTDPRGNAPSFKPSLGSQSAARYTKRFFYDYQESTSPVLLAQKFGIDLSGVARGLGDLNGDGRTDQAFGNLVRVEAPEVLLRSGSKEATRLQSTTQRIVSQMIWNDQGQVVTRIDPEGNVTEYTYYPEDDPDGDGQKTFSAYAAPSGKALGYLQSITVDSKASTRRRADSPAPTVLNTTYRYDPAGNPIGVQDGRGVTTRIEVNAANEIVALTRGAEVAAAAQNGQLLTGEEPLRYRTAFYYDSNGRVIRKESENRGGSTPGVGASIDETFRYDILDNLVAQTKEVDAGKSLITRFAYDANELLTSVTAPEGTVTALTYDERDLAFTETRGFGTPEAATQQVDYDRNGNRIRVLDAEDTDGDGRRGAVTFQRDGFDRVISVTDALGNRETCEYDPAGNLIQWQHLGQPAGQLAGPTTLLDRAFVSYDELNRRVQVDQALFLANGLTTVRPAQLTDANADGFVTTVHEYDALSRLTHVIEDDGGVALIRYDGAGRAVETMDAAGNRKVVQFDRNSNPVRVTSQEIATENMVAQETFNTWLVYDQLDRLVRATDNIGQTTRFSYDSHNHLVQRSDPEGAPTADPLKLFPTSINEPGNIVRFTYDGADRLIQVTSELRQNGSGAGALDLSNPFNSDGLSILRYDWDDNSRLIGIIDDNGNRTSYSYDALGRRTRRTMADGTFHSYTFDRDNNLVRMTDANGTAVQRTYDELNRLVRSEVVTAAPGLVGTRVETYEYDGLSRLTRSTDDNGLADRTQVFERTYDSLSRLLEERQNGRAISIAWAGDNNRLALIYPGGRKLQQTFDSIDRVASQADATGNVAQYRWIGPGYRQLVRLHGNGTRATVLTDAGDREFGYDGVPRLVSHRVVAEGGARPLLDRVYSYNRVDMRVAEKRNEDEFQGDRYTLDSLYRIVKAAFDEASIAGGVSRDLRSTEYSLDGVGNRRQLIDTIRNQNPTPLPFAVNAVNEYTAIGGSPWVYSANGNLIDDGQRTYAYDYRNRLVSVSRKSDGFPIAEYLYDTGNRRRAKTTYRQDVRGQIDSQTLYFYDHWQVIEEQNASGATLLTYVYSPVYIDALVQMERTANHPLGSGKFYLHQNARYDVATVSDANGRFAEQRVYEDFGRSYDIDKRPVNASAIGNARGFQGQYLDGETGLYYFRERFYDPDTGRFLQRDPVWDPMNSGNQYTLGGNNPATILDPYGMNGQTQARPPGGGQTRTRPSTPTPEGMQAHEAVRDVADLARIPLQLGGPLGYSKWGKAALVYEAYEEAYQAAHFTANMYDPLAYRGAGNGAVLDRMRDLKKTLEKSPFSAPTKSQVTTVKTAKTAAKVGAALQAAEVAAQGYEYYQKDERVKKLSANERDRILAEYDRLVKEAMQLSNTCLRDNLIKQLQANMEFQLNNVTDSQITEHFINGAVFIRDSLSTFIPLPTGWLWGNTAEEQGRPR